MTKKNTLDIKTSIPSFQENLVLNLKYLPNAMKFGIKNRSNLLIKNMIFEITDLDPKYLDRFGLKMQCA